MDFDNQSPRAKRALEHLRLVKDALEQLPNPPRLDFESDERGKRHLVWVPSGARVTIYQLELVNQVLENDRRVMELSYDEMLARKLSGAAKGDA